MKTRFLDLICFAVLCVILTLGLWPFHSPENTVTWLRNQNGLRFGRHGSVAGTGAFQTAISNNEASASVEIRVKPQRIWDRGTLLAFYAPGKPHQFSLHQLEAGLELKNETGGKPHHPTTARLYIESALRKSGPVFLTITSSARGTAVYADGVLVRTSPQFRFSTNDFAARLVLADSPGQPDNWSGDLLGLAFYSRELTPTQVLRHYKTWTQGGRPEISEAEGNIALYLFGEGAGNIVHNQATSGGNLNIPEKYVVWEKIFLEPFWKEFSMSWSYWDTVPKNVVGFLPFGICFYACLSAHKVKRMALVTVILGTLVSLTIEILQAYLPTRDSGTTDIITNTLGTYIGVIVWRAASPVLAARFSVAFL